MKQPLGLPFPSGQSSHFTSRSPGTLKPPDPAARLVEKQPLAPWEFCVPDRLLHGERLVQLRRRRQNPGLVVFSCPRLQADHPLRQIDLGPFDSEDFTPPAARVIGKSQGGPEIAGSAARIRRNWSCTKNPLRTLCLSVWGCMALGRLGAVCSSIRGRKHASAMQVPE